MSESHLGVSFFIGAASISYFEIRNQILEIRCPTAATRNRQTQPRRV